MPLVQKNGGAVLTNTSIPTSLPAATTAGNTILIFAQGAGTISTPSGFVSRSPQVQSQGFYFFEKLVASGNATDTPTLTMSGAYTATWQIAEYSNITAFDTSSGNIAGSQSNGVWNTPLIVPASGNKRIVAFIGGTSAGGNTWTGSNPDGWSNGFVGQQSNQTNGATSPAAQDALAAGFADNLVLAAGGGFTTSANLNSLGNGQNPASIIAAYTTTDIPAPPAGPIFRSHTSVSYASRTNTTVNAPAGLANNDILLMSMFFGNPTQGALPTPTWPTGFVEIDSTEVTQAGLGFWGKFRIAWKRASGEGSSYTITHTTSSTNVALMAYSNCIATGSPIDVYSKRWGSAVAGSDSIYHIATANSVTTTVNNTKLVFSSHDWDGTGTLLPPVAMVERYDSLVYIADEDRPSAGATGERQHLTGGSNPWAAFLIALKPVAGAGGAVTGTMAAGEAPDTASATGTVRWNAALAATEPADSASATGTVHWLANLAATESKDAASVSGVLSWNAVLAASEPADSASTTGTVRWLVTLAAPEAADSATINAAVRWLATLATSEATDTVALTGGIIASGNLAVTEAADKASLTGAIIATGALAATEAADTAAILGGIIGAGLNANIDAIEPADSAAIAGQVTGVAGRLTASEAADSAGFIAATGWSGALAALEVRDKAALAAIVYWPATLAASEAPDTAAFAGPILLTGTVEAREPADSASVVGSVVSLGTIAALESADSARIIVLASEVGTLAATEAPDTMRIVARNTGVDALDVVETPDSARFISGTPTIVYDFIAQDAPIPEVSGEREVADVTGNQMSALTINAQRTASASWDAQR